MKSCLLLVACLLGTACDDPVSGSDREETTIQRAPALTQINPGGVTVPLAKFPATCRFQGSDLCSCVLVGPEALLTAEHCVRREVIAGVERFLGSAKFANPTLLRDAECQVDETLDLAVCRIGSVADRSFERLRTDPLDTLGTDLLLTGLGCGPGFGPGTFHIGCTKVVSLPVPPDDKIGLGGPAFLCNGDSGGATYSLSSACDTGTASDVPRLVAGINSSDGTVASVSTTAANGFICDWADDNAPICGCSSAPESGCR
jgi:hypothetical protein